MATVTQAWTGADGKVFVVGTLGADASRKAALWVDGQAVDLEGGAEPSSGHAIALSGSDVIVAGELGDQACYWKNGVSFALAAPAAWPANTSVALAVVTEGVNAYFAGEGIRSTPLGNVQPRPERNPAGRWPERPDQGLDRLVHVPGLWRGLLP
jgi:hypothetical protein